MRRGFVGLCLLSLCAGVGVADDLSIYTIQSNTSDGDASIYNGQVHNVLGGVVTHIQPGGRPRVFLQDPSHATWGAIVVKDWEGGELANNVNLGDWVSFQGITIEEFVGNTFLQYNKSWTPGVSFTVESQGNPVPNPTLLTAADLVIPVNHTVTEPYESMMVTLEDVIVGQRDLGRKGDNYELLQGGDVAWGTDYTNIDAGGPYHPYIYTGAELSSITGLLEQNTSAPWDYYQLCTRTTADIVPEPTGLLLLAGLVAIRRWR